MSKNYTKKNDATGGQYIELVDGDILSIIPIDPANSDYQRYLRWLEDPTAEEGRTLS